LLMSGIRQIQYADLQFHELLGAGSKGSVYRATWKSENRQVAVKKLLELDQTEAALLNQVRHRNIIQLLGASLQRPNQCIVSELAQGGSLYDYLHDSGRDLGPDRLLNWATQIACGVRYLHDEAPQTIVHRDLKSKNVVLTADFSVCKLCDFGAARVVLGSSGVTLAGTPAWMAVEMLRGDRSAGKPCDAWSYGVVLWELLTRQVPFRGLQPLQIVYSVVEEGERLPVPPQCPTGLSLLLEKCWSEDPTKRPTFGSIVSRLEKLADPDTRAALDNFGRQREVWRGWLDAALARMRHTEEALRAQRRLLDGVRRSELAGNLRLLRLNDVNPADWRAADLCHWLAGRLGGCGDLAQYGRVMLEHGVDGAAFMALTGPDLLAMGVKSYGHRKDLLEAKERLRRISHAERHYPRLGASVEASLVSVGGAAESPGSPQCRRRSTVALSLSVHRLLRPGRVLPGPRKLLLDTALVQDASDSSAEPPVPGPHELVKSVQLLFGNSILCARMLPAPSPDGSACAFVMPDWIASPAPAAGAPSIRVEFRPRLVAKPSHCSLPLPGLWVKHWGGIEKLVQLSLADCPAASPAVSNGYYHEEAVSGLALEASASPSITATIESLSGISLLSEQQRLHPALEPERRPTFAQIVQRTASTSDPVQSPTDSWISANSSSTASSSNALAAAAAAAAAAGCVGGFRRSTSDHPVATAATSSGVGGGSFVRGHSARKSVPQAGSGGRNGASRLHPHGRYPAHRRGPGHPQHRGGGRGGGSAAWGSRGRDWQLCQLVSPYLCKNLTLRFFKRFKYRSDFLVMRNLTLRFVR
ncbi:hypothetical protein BOX15_Mlig031541g3, partial [Macrostomum lignano]